MRNGHYVIDMRARPPTTEIMKYFTPSHVRFFGDRLGMKELPRSVVECSVDGFFAEADSAGVDQLIIVHRVVPAAGGSPPSDVSNEHIAEVVSQYPKRLVGIAGIDVGGGFGDPIEATRNAVLKLGMRGIHICPTRSALAAHTDDRRLYPLYELCVELDIPVVIMTGPFAGPNIDDTHPMHIQPVAIDFPRLKIVCGHGCWPYASEMLGVAYRHENVFVSPDAYIFMPGSQVYVQAANGFLQDQLLYGSGYPVRELDKCLDDYLALGLPDKILAKTLAVNAARLLKIEIGSSAYRTAPIVT
jgi:predicted TIM-barrel fold metal-dependent hydrolase